MAAAARSGGASRKPARTGWLDRPRRHQSACAAAQPPRSPFANLRPSFLAPSPCQRRSCQRPQPGRRLRGRRAAEPAAAPPGAALMLLGGHREDCETSTCSRCGPVLRAEHWSRCQQHTCRQSGRGRVLGQRTHSGRGRPRTPLALPRGAAELAGTRPPGGRRLAHLAPTSQELSTSYDPHALVAFFGRRPLVVVTRAFEVAYKLASYATRQYLRTELGLATAEEQARLDTEELCALMSSLGPTAVKLGQLLSTREDIIGRKYARALTALQAAAPPFDDREALQVRDGGVEGWSGWAESVSERARVLSEPTVSCHNHPPAITIHLFPSVARAGAARRPAPAVRKRGRAPHRSGVARAGVPRAHAGRRRGGRQGAAARHARHHCARRLRAAAAAGRRARNHAHPVRCWGAGRASCRAGGERRNV